MKKILFFISLISCGIIYGQNTISFGEYWFDNNQGNSNALPFNPATDLNLLANLPVNDLFDGLHTVHLRFKDDNNKWTSVVSRFFIKQKEQGGSSSVFISEYEYWHNNDYESRVRKDITNLSTFSLEKNIGVGNLSNGLHTIHFRFKDTKGVWSSATSKFFIKTRVNGDAITKELTHYETWFDNNFDLRTINDLIKAKDFSLNELTDVSSLSTGLHTVHLRFKDSQSNWSSVVSKFFVVKKENNITSASLIAGYEYWFDNDINTRKSTQIANTANFSLDEQIDISALNIGLHTVHHRFTDNHGQFSSAVTRFFVIRPKKTKYTDNKIVAYRYWVNDSVMHHNKLSDTTANLLFLDSLNLRRYDKGEYYVNIQFQDQQGRWSSAITDTVQKMAFLYAKLSASIQKGCAGDSIYFSANIADADEFEWNLGDGSRDTLLAFKHEFSADGSYPISMTIKDTVQNIAKTFTLDQTIEVFKNPVLDLGDSLTLLKDESTILDASNQFTTYTWNNKTGESTLEIVANELGLGRHVITLGVQDQNGCTSEDTIIIHVRTTDGLQQQNTFQIKVFPNPTAQMVNVHWQDRSLKAVDVRIIDMQGRVMLVKHHASSETQLNIDALPSGQYLLLISTQNNTHTIPIQKVH